MDDGSWVLSYLFRGTSTWWNPWSWCLRSGPNSFILWLDSVVKKTVYKTGLAMASLIDPTVALKVDPWHNQCSFTQGTRITCWRTRRVRTLWLGKRFHSWSYAPLRSLPRCPTIQFGRTQSRSWARDGWCKSGACCGQWHVCHQGPRSSTQKITLNDLFTAFCKFNVLLYWCTLNVWPINLVTV